MVKIDALLSWAIIVHIAILSEAFAPLAIVRRSLSLSSSSLFDEWQEFSRAQTNLDIVDALVQPSRPLLEVHLVGQSALPTSSKEDTVCLVLSTTPDVDVSSSTCLLIPVAKQQLKLLSFAVQDKPLSKSVLLALNPLLVNRDGSLFDNIPWSTWTVDPQKRNYDAASNPIAPIYHLGKRDAFARFGGKDWKGRSVSIGNMALRLKYKLQQKEKPAGADVLLAKRILELQIREIQEELADHDYELAVAMQNFPENVTFCNDKREACSKRLEDANRALQGIVQAKNTKSMLASVLDAIAETTTQGGENAAPYRGAMGYSPMLDTENDIEEGLLPFTSPFGLMREILEDQCKATVIGSILENSSLLDGTLTAGGAIVLQRITAKRTVSIGGEEITLDDERVDYGTGIRGGETIIVECDVDEAIGMALEFGSPILVEREIWDTASISASQEMKQNSSNVMDMLHRWKPAQDLSFLVEGQFQNQTASEQPSSLRIPRTTTSLYEALFESNENSPSSTPLFPTDNPIQSLADYDALTMSDKARTLMSLSNFAAKLPRPRVLRTSSAKSSNKIASDPLDDLLLPLIDESVRRQYLVRKAESRGDYETVRALEAQRSKRQAAKELAEEARDVGDDEAAARWEEEAELYASLRADVTQDEGSYSRWMDRDEWYERDRQQQAKKIDRKKFGNLLDGIE